MTSGEIIFLCLIVILLVGCTPKPEPVMNLTIPEIAELAPASNPYVCVLAWKTMNVSFVCGNTSFVALLKTEGNNLSAMHPVANSCVINEVNMTGMEKICAVNAKYLFSFFETKVRISSYGIPPANFSFKLEPFYDVALPSPTAPLTLHNFTISNATQLGKPFNLTHGGG